MTYVKLASSKVLEWFKPRAFVHVIGLYSCKFSKAREWFKPRTFVQVTYESFVFVLFAFFILQFLV